MNGRSHHQVFNGHCLNIYEISLLMDDDKEADICMPASERVGPGMTMGIEDGIGVETENRGIGVCELDFLQTGTATDVTEIKRICELS